MTCEELLEKAMPMLVERLSDFRLAHSKSVADTARELAVIYCVDGSLAYTAGMLHDWDKDISEEELFEHARRYKVDVPKNHEAALSLLHAPCGAADLAERFPDIDSRIVSAIEKHTVGSAEMSDLDMVVYVADMIEPLREKKSLDDLRLLVGTVQLDELFIQCHRKSLEHLLKKGRYIDPTAVDVWNAYVERDAKKLSKAPKPKRRQVS